jgi:hypothetical protein
MILLVSGINIAKVGLDLHAGARAELLLLGKPIWYRGGLRRGATHPRRSRPALLM